MTVSGLDHANPKVRVVSEEIMLLGEIHISILLRCPNQHPTAKQPGSILHSTRISSIMRLTTSVCQGRLGRPHLCYLFAQCRAPARASFLATH